MPKPAPSGTQQQIDALTAQLASASAQITSLQKQLTDATTTLAALQAQVDSAEANAAALQTQLTAAGASLATVTAERDALRAQVTTLQAQVATLQAQLAALQPPPPPQTIVSFAPDALALVDGQSTILRWVTENATEVRVAGQVVVPSGTMVIAPHVDTLYTIEADGAVATIGSIASVTVAPKPVEIPSVVNVAMLGTKTVELEAYRTLDRYNRFQKLLVLAGAAAKLDFHGALMPDGLLRKLDAPNYSLLLDDAATVSVNVVVGTDSRSSFAPPLAGVAPGWHRVKPGNLAAGETAATYFGFNLNGWDGVDPPTMPVSRGTQELAYSASYQDQWAMVPSRYTPTARPLTVRRGNAAFDFFIRATDGVPIIPRTVLHCEHPVPVRIEDIHRPNRNKNGILSTFDVQPYEFGTTTAKYPGVPCLDGPRGVGTICSVTSVYLGTAAPNGVPRNTIYVTDGWRLIRRTEDGYIKTLFGYRHKGVPGHWEDTVAAKPLIVSALDLAAVEAAPQGTLILEGDWSLIPVERRGLHEPWGHVIDTRTTGTDPNAPLIDGEPPHFDPGVIGYITDSQNNRVLALIHPPRTRGGPVKGIELIVDIKDPFDIIYHDGHIYVSIRGENRIAEYAVDISGPLPVATFTRNVVVGQALAAVDPATRRAVRFGTLAQCRALPCVCPEGLGRVLDGKLSYTSLAQSDVRTVDLATLEIKVLHDVPTVDANSKYVKLAVDDGSTIVKWLTLTFDWTNHAGGGPFMFAPGSDGVHRRCPNLWEGGLTGGTGDWTTYALYTGAGAIGNGRMEFGWVSEGMTRITRTQAGDFGESAAVIAGRNEFVKTGLKMIHGENCFGFYGYAPPFGKTTNIDAFINHRMQGT